MIVANSTILPTSLPYIYTTSLHPKPFTYLGFLHLAIFFFFFSLSSSSNARISSQSFISKPLLLFHFQSSITGGICTFALHPLSTSCICHCPLNIPTSRFNLAVGYPVASYNSSPPSLTKFFSPAPFPPRSILYHQGLLVEINSVQTLLSPQELRPRKWCVSNTPQ